MRDVIGSVPLGLSDILSSSVFLGRNALLDNNHTIAPALSPQPAPLPSPLPQTTPALLIPSN